MYYAPHKMILYYPPTNTQVPQTTRKKKIVNLSSKWLNLRHNIIKKKKREVGGKIYNFLCKFILLKMCVLPHYRGVEVAVTVV